MLVHYTGVPEVLHQRLLALNPGVFDIADLLRIETLPLLVIKVLHKFFDKSRVDEIDKSIPNIAFILCLRL